MELELWIVPCRIRNSVVTSREISFTTLPSRCPAAAKELATHADKGFGIGFVGDGLNTPRQYLSQTSLAADIGCGRPDGRDRPALLLHGFYKPACCFHSIRRVTLTATIAARDGNRTFRYASLASGLDLVRKALGQHEIAVMQTTAVEQGQIMLTTLLVHAPGEWISPLWPVCPAGEPSPKIRGAAPTYARRYALLALVGIAGEDDLDAPELDHEPQQQQSPKQAKPQESNKASLHLPRLSSLAPDKSAELRERMLQEIWGFETDEALALWAYRSLRLKTHAAKDDAEMVEAAYLARMGDGSEPHPAPSELVSTSSGQHPEQGDGKAAPAKNGFAGPLTKSVLRRSKAHLAFVASQPCLICKSSPCDPHHLKIAQPRSLGRKVSDEFTVPLCRKHHQELHRGNEANWWANMQVTSIPIAKELWDMSPVHHPANSGPVGAGQSDEISGKRGCFAAMPGFASSRPPAIILDADDIVVA